MNDPADVESLSHQLANALKQDQENSWGRAYLDYGAGLTTALVNTNTSHDTLAELYHRHSETVRSIWTSSTVAERRKIFQKAWPHIIPDRISDLTAPMTTETTLWPSLNLNVLTDRPEPLLSFLYYRATNLPSAFRDMDFRSAFLEHEDTAIMNMDDFPWMRSMWSDRFGSKNLNFLEYKAEVTFQNEDPYYTFVIRSRKRTENYYEYWNALSARQVADIQARLYGVLAEIIQHIMGKADIVHDQERNESLYPRLRSENLTTPTSDGTTSLLSYYYGPPGFDHLGLAELVDDQANKVDGHMFSLRCSRNNLMEAVQERRSMRAVADSRTGKGVQNANKHSCAYDCLSVDVQQLDMWTALQDMHNTLAQSLEADNTSLSYMLFAMMKTHLEITIYSLMSAFGELWPGTDYSSSAYFEEPKQGQVLGQKAASHCKKTHDILLELRTFGTKIDFPYNHFVSVLSHVQRLMENSKCRLRPVVRTLLHSIILTAHCQHQLWLHFKRHVNYNRALKENNDDTILQGLRSIRDAQETWGAFSHPGSALAIHNTLERCINDLQLEVDEADPEVVQRECEKEFDARWQDLIDHLDTHEALSDAAIVTLRRPFVRSYWPPPCLRANAPKVDLSEGVDCPTLIDESLESLWDETRAAEDEKLHARKRAQVTTDAGNQLDPIGQANTAAKQLDSTGEDAIQVRKDTYETLQMIFDEPGNMYFANLRKAMEDVGFIYQQRAGSRHAFIPDPTKLSTRTPFVIHDPHHEKMERYRVERFGKDLNSIYGWTLSSFTLRPKGEGKICEE